LKWISLSGLIVICFIAYLMSENKKAVKFKLVVWGVGLQLIFGLLILKTYYGQMLFQWMKDVFTKILDFTATGARFVFGNLIFNNIPVGSGPAFANGPFLQRPDSVANAGAFFAFNVLPTIIFFSSLMAVLYYLGIMQKIIEFMAKIMAKTMGTSGSESLSAAANIFVGQTEAPLVVRPYVETMTRSELMAVMTGGMATIAGGVLAAYVNMGFDAAHLLSASVMSAPAALVIAKLMIPETEESKTAGMVKLEVKRTETNIIEAAAKGAGDGLTLALNVGAMLLAFIALIAMVNYCLGFIGDYFHYMVRGINCWELKHPTMNFEKYDIKPGDLIKFSGRINMTNRIVDIEENKIIVSERMPQTAENLSFVIIREKKVGSKKIGKEIFKGKSLKCRVGFRLSLEYLLGLLMAPLAFIMGVPWKDCTLIGSFLGQKVVLNEFVAYMNMSKVMSKLEPRSIIIASYALCGFANFGSIAIQIGGIGGIAPSRRKDLAKLGIKAMIAGSLAAFMTATIAGVLID